VIVASACAPPVQITCGVGVSLELTLAPGPGAVLLPHGEPVITRLERPVPLRDLTPLRAVLGPPQDPVDHLPVITPPATTLRDRARRQRLQPSPLLISQITSQDKLNEREPRFACHALVGPANC
jgi:hypothetical protein